MIVITHKSNHALSVFDYKSEENIHVDSRGLIDVFFKLANQFENRLVIWCEDDLKDYINFKEFEKIFHHKLIMASYNVKDFYYIDERIGYVESSPFLKISKQVTYPTWLMSSSIGGINSDVLSRYNQNDYKSKTFDYALNSIAKRGIPNGLFCYSEPTLLKTGIDIDKNGKASKYELFKFIKEHYKARWTFLTLFNSLIYEKRLFLFPFIMSFFSSKQLNKLNFKDFKDIKERNLRLTDTIDVIIPTIGRKSFLYDVLLDLSNQAALPKNVIIIEQNPVVGSKTALDYLQKKSWPFKIKHSFIHQTGACHARNIALEHIESDWVFMADDDIRFDEKTLEIALAEMHKYHLKAATLSCYREGDKKLKQSTLQWHTFGSGCSIISNQIASQLRFDMAYEHGFGEDGDFGMQIRNMGEDIGYISNCALLHLKAPVGGFRTKITNSWDNDNIQPKPSPTIMLYHLKHQTPFQIKGYKTILFLKYFKLQGNKNIFSYFSYMKKRWNKSVEIANNLKNQFN
ncbi:glycosyltransferase family 2 protein [Mariniflexile sp. HNIBRBA6329]|uniref:glycosyltransferase family 2 protein n=1 Tax=Mariniflexile sp. HNIBRBA6329 TaxID=3373088 RepID=UPI0037477FD0